MTDTVLQMNYDYLAGGGWGKVTDANGNMTKDRSRGIEKMSYNALNLPERAEFSDGSETTWVYTASGEKLRESHLSADGLSDRVTQYAGGMVFVNGRFDRYETPWGYVKEGTFGGFY